MDTNLEVRVITSEERLDTSRLARRLARMILADEAHASGEAHVQRGCDLVGDAFRTDASPSTREAT